MDWQALKIEPPVYEDVEAACRKAKLIASKSAPEVWFAATNTGDVFTVGELQTVLKQMAIYRERLREVVLWKAHARTLINAEEHHKLSVILHGPHA